MRSLETLSIKNERLFPALLGHRGTTKPIASIEKSAQFTEVKQFVRTETAESAEEFW